MLADVMLHRRALGLHLDGRGGNIDREAFFYVVLLSLALHWRTQTISSVYIAQI